MWYVLASLPNGSVQVQRVPAGHTHVYFNKDGYEPMEWDGVMPVDGAIELRMQKSGSGGQTGEAPKRLHVEGRDFVASDGKRHMIVGSTELLLACRYDFEGLQAIIPVLEERRNIGFNNLRVFWQADIKNYRPDRTAWQMPLDKMGPFLEECAKYGFWIEGTALQQCQVVNPDERDQQRWVANVLSATAGSDNYLFQLGNEWDINGFNPDNFTRPQNRICSNASNKDPIGKAKWDYWSFSGRRDLPKAIMEYGPIEYLYGDGGKGDMPVFSGEGMKPGINSNDPRDWERAGAQARSGCGGRFHHEAGTRGSSRLFDGLERACGIAFVTGLIDR
jgi:hypothetical protein